MSFLGKANRNTSNIELHIKWETTQEVKSRSDHDMGRFMDDLNHDVSPQNKVSQQTSIQSYRNKQTGRRSLTAGTVF